MGLSLPIELLVTDRKIRKLDTPIFGMLEAFEPQLGVAVYALPKVRLPG